MLNPGFEVSYIWLPSLCSFVYSMSDLFIQAAFFEYLPWGGPRSCAGNAVWMTVEFLPRNSSSGKQTPGELKWLTHWEGEDRCHEEGMWGLWTHSGGTCCLLKEVDFKLWGGPMVDQWGESILESELSGSQGLGEHSWKVACESQPRTWRSPVGKKADRKLEVQAVKVLKNSLRMVKGR